MLSWAITFLVIALIAGIFGFGLIFSVSLEFAKILFFVFLVLCIIALFRGRSRPVA